LTAQTKVLQVKCLKELLAKQDSGLEPEGATTSTEGNDQQQVSISLTH